MAIYLTTADPNGRFTEPAGNEYIDLNTGKQYLQKRNPSGSSWLVIKEGVKVELGAAYWGKIFGSIEDQDDLNNALNSKINLAGGTMTGLLKLSGDPTDDLGAATKQYVDASTLAALALDSGKIFVGNALNHAAGVDLSLNPTAGTFELDNTGLLTVPDATGSQRGFLKAADWTTFNNKERAITAGTTAQYWRGDKSFQDFGTAVRATALTGFSAGANSTILATDTILQAFGKTQGQINALPTGSGATNYIPYWTSSSALGADVGYLNYDPANHRLLYGQTSGSSIIDFVNTTTADIRGFTMRQLTSDALGARINMFKANVLGGVISNGANWVLGTFSAWGHDGTQFIESGAIKIVNTGTVATNRIASQIQFFTHPDSTTATTRRMLIDAEGSVVIGNTTTVSSDMLAVRNTEGKNRVFSAINNSSSVLLAINDPTIITGNTILRVTGSNAASGGGVNIPKAIEIDTVFTIGTNSDNVYGVNMIPSLSNAGSKTGLSAYLHRIYTDSSSVGAWNTSGSTIYGMYLDITGAANNYAVYAKAGLNYFGDNILAQGDLKLQVAGKGLYVKEGTNATMGTGTLVAGVAIINTTKVTANSRIFLTDTGGGVLANIGPLYISAINATTSFTVSSGNALDTSTFNWLLIEPA